MFGIGLGRRLLDQDGGGDEVGWRAQAADRESSRPRAWSGSRSTRSRAPAVRQVDRVRCGNSWAGSNGCAPAEGQPPPIILGCMLPAFFDSVLQLIVRTSTDLPPDVRAAMKTSLAQEPAGTRASQALTIIAQNIDLAVDHEGAICQDTGMPTFEVHVPVGAQPDRMRQPDPRGGGGGDQARQAQAQLGRLDYRRELRRQPRPRDADHPFRTVGARRDRDQADSEGRRLREHQRAVRAAGGAAAPGPRRSHRSTASGSAFCTRSGTRRAKAAAPGRSASASAAIGRPAICTPRSSCSARSTTSTPTRGWPSSKRR